MDLCQINSFRRFGTLVGNGPVFCNRHKLIFTEYLRRKHFEPAMQVTWDESVHGCKNTILDYNNVIMTSGESRPATTESIVQSQPNWCFGAAVESWARDEGIDGLDQATVIGALGDIGVYDGTEGVFVTPAEMLDRAVAPHGVNIVGLYGAQSDLGDTDPDRASEHRLDLITGALDDGKGVIVFFPKKDPKYSSFYGHDVRIKKREDGLYEVIDPDTNEGGVITADREGLKPYVVARAGNPVAAYTLQPSKSGQHIVRPSFPVSETTFSGDVRPSPYNRAKLGDPVPYDRHAVGTELRGADDGVRALLSWQIVGSAALTENGDRIPPLYGRFALSPAHQEASLKASEIITGTPSYDWLPFASAQSAERAGLLAKRRGNPEMATASEANGVFWLPPSGYNAMAWQLVGGIGTRQIDSILRGHPSVDEDRRDDALAGLKERISSWIDIDPSDMFVFPVGMPAIDAVTQALRDASDGAPTVLFNYSYGDTIDQQKLYGKDDIKLSLNVHDLRTGNYDELQKLVASGAPISCLVVEGPSNPTGVFADLWKLSEILGDIPIVLDDTAGPMSNIDTNKLPPNVIVRVSSLTKYVGDGTVYGGLASMVPRNHDKRLLVDGPQLKQRVGARYENLVWHEDAERLLESSAYYPGLVRDGNLKGNEIAEWLASEHLGDGKLLAGVLHPSLDPMSRRNFDRVRPDGVDGYGTVVTLTFRAPQIAMDFFRVIGMPVTPSFGLPDDSITPYDLLVYKTDGSIKDVANLGIERFMARIGFGRGKTKDSKEVLSRALVEVAGLNGISV